MIVQPYHSCCDLLSM